jgi:hypothetical protein
MNDDGIIAFRYAKLAKRYIANYGLEGLTIKKVTNKELKELRKTI